MKGATFRNLLARHGQQIVSLLLDTLTNCSANTWQYAFYSGFTSGPTACKKSCSRYSKRPNSLHVLVSVICRSICHKFLSMGMFTQFRTSPMNYLPNSSRDLGYTAFECIPDFYIAHPLKKNTDRIVKHLSARGFEV